MGQTLENKRTDNKLHNHIKTYTNFFLWLAIFLWLALWLYFLGCHTNIIILQPHPIKLPCGDQILLLRELKEFIPFFMLCKDINDEIKNSKNF